ncbi:nitrite reductase small subunit [Alcanivorax hongdengensis A-11-3]|uniref:Nitrite reductase small subunit n=1 Tax=Alcanivorax hongdengensis A-11-3 TaxID=1177179 RepID=L0WDR6_9GAMM|nr:nitrite reductase small subunit NirD [Alcanivorax hongdengensis]EKF75186.1 nitrite reductase small subunit [Alcanivorax hongdengensis A-11-3]
MNSAVNVEWQPVCRLEEVLPGTGVGVRLAGGQAALFRTREDELFALDNHDPFSRANVLSRGLLGSLGGKKVVASPIYKQHFCLDSGQCLEDESVRLTVYPVRLNGSQVEVGVAV